MKATLQAFGEDVITAVVATLFVLVVVPGLLVLAGIGWLVPSTAPAIAAALSAWDCEGGE